ncbi:hypothetical protein [Actinomycetospora chibensis]|uniref:Uncharacterized protein n=1 Tax=Actinomycetospora chibensis TaxID=663606 RepID=A0ABV9RP85_9PSEU|nr:hypothetical protein [Actinomycetospora chibensis]MDD7927202.1 hypothetical protein [Actinomycetospora chibensis]
MTFLIIVTVVVVAIVGFRIARKGRARDEYEQRSAQQPLDPGLSEVFHRTAGESDWKARRLADDALREATPHVHRLTREIGQAPVLILHQRTDNSYLAKGGLLVVTTDRTLLFSEGRLSSVSHSSGTTTRIQGTGTTFWIEIEGGDGSFTYACDNLEIARLVCATIDMWADNLDVRYIPGAHITPERVHIPVDFYAGVLQASRYPVTHSNLRALQERFGMLFIHYTRKLIDSTSGLAVGEHFTRDHGRPTDDRELPQWPERVLRGLIALDRDAGYVMAPFLPGRVHSILLEDYLAHPERPLSMWMSNEYENDGTGARRHGSYGALPPMST